MMTVMSYLVSCFQNKFQYLTYYVFLFMFLIKIGKEIIFYGFCSSIFFLDIRLDIFFLVCDKVEINYLRICVSSGWKQYIM